MSTSPRWLLSGEEQAAYIRALTDDLAPLRAKLGISQSELSYLVGMSRQTYSGIESGRRPMSWSTYLALLMFFDYNQETHEMLRNIRAFPAEIVGRFNRENQLFAQRNFCLEGKTAEETTEMFRALDEQGVESLKTTLLVEYARCTNATRALFKALK